MTPDLSSLSAAAPIDPATLPAEVRNGSSKDKQAYTAALGFEQMLLSQLAQGLVQTSSAAGGLDSSDSSSSGDGTGSEDSGSGDAAGQMYQQMLPDQIASAVSGAGGVGLADQLYRSMVGK